MNNSNQTITVTVSIFIILLCSAFGANVVAVKIALTGMSIFTIAFMRFFIAVIVIFLWAFITGRTFKIEKKYFKQLLVISVIFTIQLALFYLGISKTNATNAVLLANTQPFFVLILAHFFISGDKINSKKIFGMVVGFTGVLIVFLGKSDVSLELQSGDFIIVLVSFIWGCNAVYVKRIIHNFIPFHLVFYPMLFALPFYLAGAFFLDDKMVSLINRGIVLSLMYQGMLTASFGFIVWTTLIKKYGVVTLHSYIFIMPISGVFFSGLILNEPIGYNVFFAMLFITAGIVIINVKKGLFLKK